ncbi:hypothetical protein SAMN05443246_4081 [Paenibacillus sp. GP183]|jgi:hypothetical protein|nr:hypothetical protein SAMN05443246_4081 [Paenibacillus sp. GP183]
MRLSRSKAKNFAISCSICVLAGSKFVHSDTFEISSIDKLMADGPWRLRAMAITIPLQRKKYAIRHWMVL